MRVQVVEIWVRILILFIFLACSSPREKQGCISEERCPQETTPGKKNSMNFGYFLNSTKIFDLVWK